MEDSGFLDQKDQYQMELLRYHIVLFIFKHDDEFLSSRLEAVKNLWGRFKRERSQLGPSDMERAIEDIVGPLYQLAEDLDNLYHSCEHTYHPWGQVPDEAPFNLDLEPSIDLPSAENAHYHHQRTVSEACVVEAHASVFHEIKSWANDRDTPIFWLSGMVGTGKSVIARVIAKKFSENGWLGATFFCSREDPDRRNPKLLFSTLAVQLRRERPEFQSGLMQTSKAYPGRFESWDMEKLILKPLQLSGISERLIFIVDGLDEFEGEEIVEKILSVLEKSTVKFRKRHLKFLITSRPKKRIQRKFSRMGPDVKTFSLQEVQRSQ